MTAWKMPARLSEDGPVGVRRVNDDHLAIGLGDDVNRLVVSRYNAARIFAMLAMFLEVPLPKKLAAAIQLCPQGKDFKMTVGFPAPTTLGQRLVQSLMPDRIGDFVKVLESDE